MAIKVHEANCILDRALVEKEIHELTQDNRRELRNFGVKFGRSAIYLPLLLKPKAASLNAILTHFSKGKSGEVFVPVSYTHLDVYKRQPLSFGAIGSADLT